MDSNSHTVGHAGISRQSIRLICLGLLTSITCGCALIPYGEYTNDRTSRPENACAASPGDPPGSDTVDSRATLNVKPDRGDRDTLFILALSGGGSRSANWSAQTMLQLQHVFPELDLLAQVDVISSVSGGSLPAAYYAISTDPNEARLYGRVWDNANVSDVMRRNYIARWFGYWFWPTNIAQYWFTAYDRTDIMAQTFADNVFDTRPLGRDLKMRDLRCARPYLILNSANATKGADDALFSFTTEQFATIDSNLGGYELARAVMASATFPGVFNDMTLRNFQPPEQPDPKNRRRFVHVFDGGNNDNLGLHGAANVLQEMKARETPYKKLVVVLVDAYTNRNGVDEHDADPRGFLDFIVDTNFLNATGALLFRNRDSILTDFTDNLRTRYAIPGAQNTLFYHVTFDDIANEALKREVNKIGTNFQISKTDADNLAEAARELINPNNRCLLAIKHLIVDGATHLPDVTCSASGRP